MPRGKALIGVALLAVAGCQMPQGKDAAERFSKQADVIPVCRDLEGLTQEQHAIAERSWVLAASSLAAEDIYFKDVVGPCIPLTYIQPTTSPEKGSRATPETAYVEIEPESRTWIPGQRFNQQERAEYTAGVTVHELGHMMGLLHLHDHANAITGMGAELLAYQLPRGLSDTVMGDTEDACTIDDGAFACAIPAFQARCLHLYADPASRYHNELMQAMRVGREGSDGSFLQAFSMHISRDPLCCEEPRQQSRQ